ncbi:hypothetical protein AMAG_18232 [Allomyces macrogynus ATCC 38327]|uniref:PX domain-containing protein n=1 Tax=Allomyces macrogynus (strain ATCC 38327) TaxID=578462 RepID=A0A0L0S765_ALLM3|nr:hypothetical protein AMAG_18232 [Allomyces macrogynus ATCC 38327]|eukprot:KNE58362.1 hypothetical protein AMAG_18232 [Allomyces macrogynus ATCC 38327]
MSQPASGTTVSTASVGTGGTGTADDDTDPRTVLIGHARGMRHPAVGDSTAELVPRRVIETKQARAKEDRPLIDRRKRLLQSFLNRVAWHPILSTEHLFHRFLEPGAVWSDVLHAAKVTTLPTSAVAAAAATSASSTTATTTTASLASSLLGLGTTTNPSAAAVKHPDPKFVEAEAFTLKFEAHVKDVA